MEAALIDLREALEVLENSKRYISDTRHNIKMAMKMIENKDNIMPVIIELLEETAREMQSRRHVLSTYLVDYANDRLRNDVTEEQEALRKKIHTLNLIP